MTSRSVSILLSVIVPATLSGCAGGYILSHYGTAANKVVKTSCGGDYRVSEKDGKLLVSAYAATELYHSICEFSAAQPDGRRLTNSRPSNISTNPIVPNA